MGLGNFNPGCDCCECEIATDYFNREDSTDLGAAWREVSGDWYIENEVLKIDEGGSAAWLIVPAADDVNWWALEADPAEGCGILRFFFSFNESIDLVPVITVKALTLDEWHTLSACYFKREYPEVGYFILKVTTASGVLRWIKWYLDVEDGNAPDADGWTTGLGSPTDAFVRHLATNPDDSPNFAVRVRFKVPTTGPIEFDDFLVYRSQSETDPECPDCKPPSCAVGSDNFNRADSDDIGCEWEEYSGDFDIASNALASVTAGHARYLVPHATPADKNILISTQVTGASGKTARIVVETDLTDPGEYVYGEVALGPSGTLKVGVRSGGSDTVLDTVTGSFSSGTYAFCVSPVRMLMTGGGSGIGAATASSIPSMIYYPGLIADSGMAFDDWVVQISQSDDFPACTPCTISYPCTACQDNVMAQAYVAELLGTFAEGGGCSTPSTPCSDLNAGWLIDPAAVFSNLSACYMDRQWTVAMGVIPCGNSMTIEIAFGDTSGGMGTAWSASVVVRFQNFATTVDPDDYVEYRFQKNYGSTKPDCLNFSNENIPFIEKVYNLIEIGGGPSAFDSFPHCDWTDPELRLDAA